jgi:hypothetical protein
MVVLPLLSIFFICKTNLVVGPEVDLDTRILLAGGVAGGFAIFVMLAIVVVAIFEEEPEWAKTYVVDKKK